MDVQVESSKDHGSIISDSTDILFARYARSRDKRTRERLVLCHQKLVRHICARFTHGGEPLDDLIQVGNIGLIKAIDRFDPGRHLKFTTFAFPTIAGEIQRYLRDSTWSVDVARPLKDLYVRALKVKSDLTSQCGRVPTVLEISDVLHVPEEMVLRAMDLQTIRHSVSFAKLLRSEAGSDLTVADTLREQEATSTSIETQIDLSGAIDELEPTERTVIVGSYFKGLTQADIGQQMKISQMQVSRLHRRALSHLKALL